MLNAALARLLREVADILTDLPPIESLPNIDFESHPAVTVEWEFSRHRYFQFSIRDQSDVLHYETRNGTDRESGCIQLTGHDALSHIRERFREIVR